MASQSILNRLQAEFDSPPEAIAKVVARLEEGAPPAYLSHFCRHEIGNIGEDRLHAIAERLHFLADLEGRKQSIREQAEKASRLTEELQRVLDTSVDQDLIDDLYQSLRPRRRTPGMQMEEKGLLPLALAIEHKQLGELTLQDAAKDYLGEDKGMPATENVLEGVLVILAERIGSDPKVRARFREELSHGVLRARAVDPSRGSSQPYQEFFDFQENITRIPGHRMLALRRAEREGILQLELTLPPGRAREVLRELRSDDLPDGSQLRAFLDLVYDHAFENQLKEGCGRDVRRRMKEKADREAVRTFARNLRSQLLAPALGNKKVLALRSSSKNAWAALVGEDGSVLQHKSLALATDEERKASMEWLAGILTNDKPAAIAIPHGRRQSGTEHVVKALREAAGELPPVFPVDEAASAIFATSASGRRALPGVEVGLRAAISLGRRLQDPMRELIRMDFRTMGLGQSLDDVHQGVLRRELDWVVTSCIASVGTDLNTADQQALTHVPGITPELANAIVEHRRQHGGFKTRLALAEVQGIGERTCRHICGFVRILGGDEPLDATLLHPDEYPVARKIAEQKAMPVTELAGKDLGRVDLDALTADGTERGVVLGVLHALAETGKDPRGELSAVRNEGINSLDDLRTDLQLTGRVANLTEFGAFIDMGLGQDGLVHISQIPQSRLRHQDNTLRVGEVVTVWVLNLDKETKKIALTMHQPRHLAEGRQPTLGERMQVKGARGPRGPKPQRREPEPVFSRAARAPEGRRGGRRGGPERREGGGGPPRGGEDGPRRDFDRDSRGPRRRDGGGRGGGEPRVFTIESGAPHEEQKGKKGEFTSLASLRALLQPKEAKEAPPPTSGGEGPAAPSAPV